QLGGVGLVDARDQQVLRVVTQVQIIEQRRRKGVVPVEAVKEAVVDAIGLLGGKGLRQCRRRGARRAVIVNRDRHVVLVADVVVHTQVEQAGVRNNRA